MLVVHAFNVLVITTYHAYIAMYLANLLYQCYTLHMREREVKKEGERKGGRKGGREQARDINYDIRLCT